MKPQCIQAVQDHLTALHGKPVKLTAAAIKRIDERMHEGAKVLARRDRAAWQNMSADDRTIAIGKWVREQEQIAADATARSQLRQLSALTHQAQRMNDFAAARKDKPGKWGKSVIDILEGVDNSMRGAELVALNGFNDLMKGAAKGSVFDFANTKNDNFFADVVREIYGNDTGNSLAKQFADKWSGNMEGYREARNRAGGTVGKLERYAPQRHDTTVMQRVGEDKWHQFMMQNLDRTQYMDAEGRQLSDAELSKVVSGMWTTITRDGANKVEIDANGLAATAAQGGTSNIAKALNNQHREIHFADAEAVINYNKQFSDKSLGSTFYDHMLSNARDVAMINELGPNPDTTFATLRDTARIRDGKMPGAVTNRDGSIRGASRSGVSPDGFYRQMRGGHDYAWYDDISAAMTAYQAATKLTNTALRSVFQDTPGILLNMADVGQVRKVGTIIRSAFNPEEAARFGIGADTALYHAKYGSARILSQSRLNKGNAINRYAQATMKYTGLDIWTGAVRRAGQTSHALALGEWSRSAWQDLDNGQRLMLNNAGIQEADWMHIMNVPRQQLRGNDIHDVADVMQLGLDVDEAMRLQSKMMGFVRMGGDIVTSEHNLTSQTVMSMGGRSNAVHKQTMLFKSAGGAQTAHMLDRYTRASSTGKIGYIAATASMGVGFGYMALCAQAVVAGQNPPPLNDWRTIGKAMAVSGGFAFLQDVVTSFYDGVSGDNAGKSTSVIPAVGDLYTLGKIAFSGDANKSGYMALRFARQQFAPLNYWYTKAAIDHLFFNDAAEGMNPGYQKRLRSYADQKGQQYFYDPSGTGGEDFGTGYYKNPMPIFGE